MELKPGYKQTEVGVIPEDWTNKTLGELASVSSGGTPSRTNSKYWNGDIPWITTSEVDFCVVRQAQQFITKEGLDNSAANLLPSGTLLMALYGQGKTRGKVAILGIEAATNQACAAIILNNSVFKDFVFHYLISQYETIRTLSNTGNQENLNSLLVRSIPILLPSDSEQKAIATALSDIDNLLGVLDRLIAKKQNLKQSAMQELLTGKKRLSGFGKTKRYKSTEAGNIPEDWDVVSLGERSQVFGRIGFRGYTVKDIVEKGEGAISISPSNICDGQTDFKHSTYISFAKYDESPEIKIQNGDILLVKTGSTFGKTAIVRGLSEKATLNPQVVVLKKLRTNNIFLGYMMEFETIQCQISRAIVGGALPTLSQSLISQFKFPEPPTKKEQKAIANILSDMDTEIAALKKRRDKTQNIKQAMMQELLTGKTRLIG